VNFSIKISLAFYDSKVGGNLSEHLTSVSLLTTFPAFDISGNPYAPVIERFAFQTLFKYNYFKLSYSRAYTPSCILYFLY